MMRKLYNLWLRYKTKNFTKIPLFTMVFDYQKFRENGKGKELRSVCHTPGYCHR